MGNERQAHLGVWFSKGEMIHTYQPPLADEADDLHMGLAAVVADVSDHNVIPIGVSVRISRKDNVVISWETGDGTTHELVLRIADAKDFLFDETNHPVSIKFIGIG